MIDDGDWELVGEQVSSGWWEERETGAEGGGCSHSFSHSESRKQDALTFVGKLARNGKRMKMKGRR